VLRPAWSLPAWPSAAYASTLLLVLALPFDALPPIVQTPWLQLGDLKLALALAGLAYLLGGLPSRRELSLAVPAIVLLGIATVSAALSDFADDGLRAALRLAIGAFGLLVGLRSAREGVLWAIITGAGLSALLGLGEAAGWHALDPILESFKVAPTRVGGELRVSASFQYATIAAMYFEMAVPIGLVLATTTRRRPARLLALAGALVCTAAVVLTLTRAGMLTLGIIFGMLLVLAWRLPAWRGLLRPTLLASGVLVGLVGVEIARDPVFDLRLVTENDADWYGAVYSAPQHLELRAQQPATVSLEVRNAGRIVWSAHDSAHPFALGYRWLSADNASVLDRPPGLVELPHDVAPGESLHIEAPIAAEQLPPGTYRLAWGMVQQDVVQFYERGWPNAETLVQVDGPAGDAPPPAPAVLPRDDAEAPWVVPRVYLWQAAVRLIAQRPLLGQGPDNFRHLYGAELGLDSWDERIQANNLYLELLVDLGLVGLLSFGWVLLGPLRRMLSVLRAVPTGRESFWTLGAGLAIVAFLVHGLLDTFLAFVPTALLFWLCLGFVLAQKPHVSGR
jgi:O-antigen ligase